ncbi:hypothetical protein BH10PSE17_BH10PSE17_25030 [soil metagenome]
MALHLISNDDLRSECRRRIEACELWLRRLVHVELSKHGQDYVANGMLSGQHLFNGHARKLAATRMAQQSKSRAVDTLLLDDLATVICKADVYKTHFCDAFNPHFTNSANLRTILARLIPIRNALSHANPISLREAEQALCYCADVMDAISEHFRIQGMERDFDAPTFTRYTDSLGNSVQLDVGTTNPFYVFASRLRCGETLRAEVEIDAHFEPSTYEIHWSWASISSRNASDRGTGHSFVLRLEPRHVGMSFQISVAVKSDKEWHRQGSVDQIIFIEYCVLPPL